MTRRDLAVRLTMMYFNENRPNTYSLDELLAGAIDIFADLDEYIDYYIREVDDRLYRSRGLQDYDVNEDSFTAYEWGLVAILEGLKERRNK